MQVNYNWYTDFASDSTLWAVRFQKFRELNKYGFTTIQRAKEYAKDIEEELSKEFEEVNSLSHEYAEQCNKPTAVLQETITPSLPKGYEST